MRAKAIGELIPQGSVAAVASDSGRVAELEKALSAARAEKETALEMSEAAARKSAAMLEQARMEYEAALEKAMAETREKEAGLTTAIVRNDELLMQVERLETRAATEDRTPPSILNCFSLPRMF